MKAPATPADYARARRYGWDCLCGKCPPISTGFVPDCPGPPSARERKPARSWPAPSASGFYARVSEGFAIDRNVRGVARALGLLLVRLARGRPSCDAWIDQLADLLQCSPRSIQRAQRCLEARWYLKVEHVREGRINDANRYHLLAAILPPRPSYGRRRVGVTKTSPHEERAKALPPVVPPCRVDEIRPAQRAAPPPSPPRIRGGGSARQADGATAVPRRRATGPP